MCLEWNLPGSRLILHFYSLTLSKPHVRFENNLPLCFQVIRPQNGRAILKRLRAILMQFDLFAVRWNSAFQCARMSFCPENVGNWSSSPQNESELPPIYLELFPASQGPSCRKSLSALFRSNWVNCRLQSSIGSKKRGVSRFSRDPVAGNHRQHFFDPTGSNTVTNRPSDRKKVLFPASQRAQ